MKNFVQHTLKYLAICAALTLGAHAIAAEKKTAIPVEFKGLKAADIALICAYHTYTISDSVLRDKKLDDKEKGETVAKAYIVLQIWLERTDRIAGAEDRLTKTLERQNASVRGIQRNYCVRTGWAYYQQMAPEQSKRIRNTAIDSLKKSFQ